MRNATSLEEEKRQLLAQIESSRAVYRRMLTQSDKHAPDTSQYAAHGRQPAVRPGKFPQNQVVNWIVKHPYLTVTAVAAIVAIGPRRIMRTIRNPVAAVKGRAPKAEPAKADAKEVAKTGLTATLGTSLLTAAAMILRNPAAMEAVTRTFTTVMRQIRSGRSRY